MNDQKKIQLNLAIPEHYRDLLRRMAAERVMNDPSEVATGTSIATELLLNALKEISKQMIQSGGIEND